ncbi:MAG: hypothetical protein H6841_00030 [Planctomycetes bacterium]|nr:hypothetical protein [Planctomycetota bacterium]
MNTPETHPEPQPDKATRKLPSSVDETTRLLRQKYTRRREAIKRFTERLQKGVYPDDAETNLLRDVGVSEAEIRGLVEQYA